IKKETDYKISFINKKGYPFLFKRFIRKKELLIALFLCFFLIIALSNIVWKVQITGVPKDIEEKINKQLDSYGIRPGTLSFSLDSASSIQQKLMNDIPELLWVGVHKKGTTFFLEGVEKIIVEEEEVAGPQNLVATKKGVIKNIYVSKGLPKVKVNDYVKLGDILVSVDITEYNEEIAGPQNLINKNKGIIKNIYVSKELHKVKVNEYVKPGDILVSGDITENNEENEEEDKKEKKKSKLLAAEGDITAKTWYE